MDGHPGLSSTAPRDLIRAAALLLAASLALIGLLAVSPARAATGAELGNLTVAGAVEVQPDGRIVVAGTTQDCDQHEFGFCSGEPASPFVARFTAAGELDSDFGAGDGIAVLSVPDGAVKLVGLALLSDGRIVTATEPRFGRTDARPGSLSVVRLNRDGSLDAGFGQAGIASLGRERFFGGSNNALAVDASGRILVAGSGPGGPEDAGDQFAVVRFLAGGDLDPGFGSAGIASLRVDPAAERERADALVVRSDGRILLAGGSGRLQPGSTLKQGGFAAAQLLPSGSPDPAFSGDGRTVVAAVSSHQLSVGAGAVSLRTGGGVLLTGSRDISFHPCAHVIVAALTEAGELDPDYGQGGLAEHPAQCAGATDAVLSRSNQLLAAVAIGGQTQVAAFDPAGMPDASYGANAIATPSILGLGGTLYGLARAGSQSLLGAGTAVSDHCRRGRHESARCSALLLAKLDASGDLEEDFGNEGFVTVPAVCRGPRSDACALSRRQFKRLVRQGLPKTVRYGDPIRVRFACKRRIGESCRVSLRLKLKRHRRTVGRTSRFRLGPGRRRALTVALSRSAGDRLKAARRVHVRAKVATRSQKAALVSRSVRIRDG